MNVNLIRAQHGHEFDLDETRDPYLLIPADPEKVRALAGALRTVAADGLLPVNARLVEGRMRVVPWHGDAGDAVRTRLSLYDSITADMARLADQSAGLLEAYAEHITLARAQAWQSVNEYATGRALSGVGRYAEGVSWCQLGVTRLAMARAALRAAAALLSTALDQVSQVLPTSPSLGEHPAWHVMLLGQNLLDGLAGMADLALWFCDTDRALVTMINPLVSEQHRRDAAEHVRGVTAKLLALADHPDKIARALADSTTLELSPLAWALGMGDPFAKDRSIMQIIRSEYAPPTRYQLLDQQRLVVGRPYGFSAGAGPTVPDTLDAGDVADFQLPTGLHEDLAVRGDGGLVHNGWDDTEDVVPDYSDDVGVEDHHAVDYRLHHADMDEYRHRWPANDSLDDYRHERDLENTRLTQQRLTRPEVLPLNTPATTTGWQLPDDGPPLTATQKLAHERALMAQGDITDLVEGHGRIPAHVKNLLWADPAYRQSAQDTLDTLLTRLHGQDPATLGTYGEQLLAQQTERAHRLRGR